MASESSKKADSWQRELKEKLNENILNQNRWRNQIGAQKSVIEKRITEHEKDLQEFIQALEEDENQTGSEHESDDEEAKKEKRKDRKAYEKLWKQTEDAADAINEAKKA